MNNKINYYKYIIVGAGIAGLTAIKGIRSLDTEGRILLLSNEERLPYKRTKVNKHIAKGFSTNDFALKPKQWYKEQKVDLIYDELKDIINKDQKITTRTNGYTYEKLLLCMGAESNIPTIAGLADIKYHFVHYAHEVEAIIKQVRNKKHYLIIGGGIEGLETADQLINLNKKITIVQRSKNPLRELFPTAITNSINQIIATSPIRYLEGCQIKTIQKHGKQYFAQTEKEEIIADELIICTGSKPKLQGLNQSSIKTNKGILVNEYLQTNDANVYAAGDIIEQSNGRITGLWHPAEYQGLAAGKNMAGKKEQYKTVPYRLKSEFLGQFLFSANYYQVKDSALEQTIESNGGIHRELYSKDGKIVAMVMQNDKERRKLYQKAVAEQWSIEQFQKDIPLT